ncbi:SMC-Scp complex subunit ScpB [Mycoplasma sp. Ms02]|uniref:SMC-Scp complex subunit ScpB n=1 Tax=Mycoplasma sp. Ms02 TaxID=353851 RepID=UPI001C8AFB00|nr:SMC-Scp complex subunit ScpB [Mycoplasma sp. Ms02]QZE12553.1 segregation/condensation protein B [Mycoplasma sp. Ms02]
MKNKILEALLYVQGDAGLTLEQVKDIFNLSNLMEAKKIVMDFIKEYNAEERGLKVVEFNDVYKLATRESMKEYVSKMVNMNNRQRLSNSAIEVAGIVAYKQPVTRGQITNIRGGRSSDNIIQTLLIKGIIKEVGRASTPGNPTLYGVTDLFYDYFKIKSLSELPPLKDFNYIDTQEQEQEDFDLYGSQREF